jgi:hypothetical protein
MTRYGIAGALALAWVAAAAGPRADAQFTYQRPQTNPYGTPAVSPYLNMVRAGTNPAINYYGLVRPQMDTARALQTLQQQYTFGVTNVPEDNAGNGLSITGHAVQFFNYGTYFPQGVAGRTGGVGALGGQNLLQPYSRAPVRR